ncbi:ABC transporter ATP-binding protein [Gilvibacter sediminis]|uniref:ABC transporter ATP-binding protein n=1 Tax=Gilvibacter sediminis TaxID=379071 RepID=UPI002350D33C|nr:ABC transporter ATP-binding protein [Gilvibacter sediminis]MDC7999055.1 ABC transporter ATP-binding protein [Gilvibacter sediminis]
MEKSAAITLQDLSIGYGKGKTQTVVAKDIDLTIKTGGLYGLIGINGAGKSTLIKTLNGSLNPLQGKVWFDKQQLKSLSPTERAKLFSVVLTKSPISLNLSCYELIALGRHPYTNWMGVLREQDKQAVEDALLKTDLLELKDRKCFELSDGQLQRALLARAIAQHTPLIILDEPTTHLDMHHKFKMLKLMDELAAEGKTIIYATHDLEQALDLCDELLIFQGTQIVMHTPESAVETGIIGQLFPEQTVKFDASNKRFFLNK